MTLTTAMGGRAQKEKAVRLVGKKGRCLVVGGGIYMARDGLEIGVSCSPY